MDDGLKYADELMGKIDDDEEDIKIIAKAKRDAKYQFYKTLFLRSFVQDFMSDGKVPDEAILTLEDQQIITRQALRNTTKSPYAFVTFNIDEKKCNLEVLQKTLIIFLKTKAIKEYAYVFEIRACENSQFTGLHAHVLLRYTCRPWDLHRSAKTKFKNLMNVDNHSCLNIKYIAELLLPDKINYMLGGKKQSKQKGVELSREYRALHNLEEIYDSCPPLPCRATPQIIE